MLNREYEVGYRGQAGNLKFSGYIIISARDLVDVERAIREYLVERKGVSLYAKVDVADTKNTPCSPGILAILDDGKLDKKANHSFTIGEQPEGWLEHLLHRHRNGTTPQTRP